MRIIRILSFIMTSVMLLNTFSYAVAEELGRDSINVEVKWIKPISSLPPGLRNPIDVLSSFFKSHQGTDDTINFEIRVTCNDCYIKNVDVKQSKVNAIYPTQRRINGMLEDISVREDILRSADAMYYDNRVFKGLRTRRDMAILRYSDGNIKVGDVTKFDIDATINVEVLHQNQQEVVSKIENVIIKDSKQKYIKTENDSVFMALIPGRGSTTINNQDTFYDYRVEGAGKSFTNISIVDAGEELFLDNRIFGGVLEMGRYDEDKGRIEKRPNKIFMPEKYFNIPFDMNVYYLPFNTYEIPIDHEVMVHNKY